MSFDLILPQARIPGREGDLVGIAVTGGRIAAIGPRGERCRRSRTKGTQPQRGVGGCRLFRVGT
jgi:hypothetical protein